jgi:hypothetical protein
MYLLDDLTKSLRLKILPLTHVDPGFCGDLSRNSFVFKIRRGRGSGGLMGELMIQLQKF